MKSVPELGELGLIDSLVSVLVGLPWLLSSTYLQCDQFSRSQVGGTK